MITDEQIDNLKELDYEVFGDKETSFYWVQRARKEGNIIEQQDDKSPTERDA